MSRLFPGELHCHLEATDCPQDMQAESCLAISAGWLRFYEDEVALNIVDDGAHALLDGVSRGIDHELGRILQIRSRRRLRPP